MTLSPGVKELLFLFLFFAEYRFIVTILAVIGKACILATFLGIYVFTVELYPTIIRLVLWLRVLTGAHRFLASRVHHSQKPFREIRAVLVLRVVTAKVRHVLYAPKF